MSPLERHCQLLMRVYPAAYREVRGEEIIGTLLEATPPGRSWPRARDVRCLIFGGLRARAAFNRQVTTAANLRVAVLAGVAACLAYGSVATLTFSARAEVSAHNQHATVGWPLILAAVLTLLAVGAAMLTSIRGLVLAAALPAAAFVCYAGPWGPGMTGAVVYRLVLLAALVALAPLAGGSARLSRRWLVPVGVLALLPVLPVVMPLSAPVGYEGPLLALAAISIGWAAIDARPAIAVIVFFLGFYLPIAANLLTLGAFPVVVLPYLGVLTAIGLAAGWLLRRQSAHPGRATRT
jgi:hypothetical protein